MSDNTILENKIDLLGVDVRKLESKLDVELKDIKLSMNEVDGRLDAHSEELRSLLQWRDSNGSPGAEERLRVVEHCSVELEKEKLPPRVGVLEAHVVTLQRIADSAIMEGVQVAVNDTLDKRDRTVIAKIKAWGPIVSAALAAAALVLAAVL